MDWTQFFNPSSWGSFAPQMGAPGGAISPIGKETAAPMAAAPAAAGAAAGGMPSAALFQMGQRMINPQQPVPPMAPIHFVQPVGPGRMGMLG